MVLGFVQMKQMKDLFLSNEGRLVVADDFVVDFLAFNEWAVEVDHALHRQVFLGLVVVPTILLVGRAGTGTPLHFHGPTFNFLLHGQKRWYFSPPENGAWSNTHMTDVTTSPEDNSPHVDSLLQVQRHV